MVSWATTIHRYGFLLKLIIKYRSIISDMFSKLNSFAISISVRTSGVLPGLLLTGLVLHSLLLMLVLDVY